MKLPIKIKFDSSNNVIPPTLVLSNRSGRKIGSLPIYDIVCKDNLNSYSELVGRIDKYDNGMKYAYWDQVRDFKLVWCREWDTWFVLSVDLNQSTSTSKAITAISLGESELSQIRLYGTEINTEDDIARDDYEPTVLYDASNPNASLLDRIMEKAPHYTVKHVDLSITNIQRIFSFDDISLYDALQEICEEINCIVVFDNGSDEHGKPARGISIYDLESYCPECNYRGEFLKACPKCGNTNILTGYGEDTTIFISTDNLAEEITYAADVDSVKNCFRLKAGDDLMTATLMNCNPNGSAYIWYISDEIKEDMSPELVSKLNAYDDLYEQYQNSYSISLDSTLVGKYNNLVHKYSATNEDIKTVSSPIIGYPNLMNAYYDTIDFSIYLSDGMMPSPTLPDTSAQDQIANLTASKLSPVSVADVSKVSVSTASSAVLSMAKVLVDSRYQVKINSESLSSTTWSGSFVVTNYSNEEDTATSAQISVTINDDYENFVKQKLDIMLNKESDNANDIVSIFKLEDSKFQTEITKYCLSTLNIFYDACQACMNVLIEQGIADDEAWKDSDPNLYETIYLPYYRKSGYLSDEIKLRESEIAVISGSYDKTGVLKSNGLQNAIESEKNKIQNDLNFEKYLGHDLWIEFVAYRREDTYQNDNYISDGLDNAQLFKNALEFINVAQKDIYKSSTLQHSISATLKNLLVMKEFSPIVDYFSCGNWMRVSINDSIYRLRLINYEISFNDLSHLSIEFSDVIQVRDGVSDVEDILSQASSITKSYDSVSRQAGQGEKGNKKLDQWVNEGLALTKMKIIDNAENQDIVWDGNGMLFRQYDSITDSYDDRQLKIINHGLYLTDDRWMTSKAGIGRFMYYDPKTGLYTESYGVIADTLVGNLILSEEVGIYNSSNSITMDKNGFILTTEADSNQTAFTIQKKIIDSNGNEALTPLMYVNNNGELVINGSIKVSSSSSSSGTETTLDEKINNAVQDADIDVDVGGRNYIRNSKTMIFDSYGFINSDEEIALCDTAIVGTSVAG